jgi:hypothetical protein
VKLLRGLISETGNLVNDNPALLLFGSGRTPGKGAVTVKFLACSMQKGVGKFGK